MDQKVKYIKRIISAIISGCTKLATPYAYCKICLQRITNYCVKILTLPGRK